MELPTTAKRSAVIFTFLLIIPVLCSAGIIHKYQIKLNSPIPKPDSDPKKSTAGWMEDAFLEIPEHLIIGDLDVGVNISHTSAFDLQLFLQSPKGTRICLNRYNFDEFFEGADYLNTIFDDEANLPIENAEPPFAGKFKPKAPSLLQNFDGQDAFGIWKLQIYDKWYADTGTLEKFELTITTPEPHSAMLFIISAAAILLKPKKPQIKK